VTVIFLSSLYIIKQQLARLEAQAQNGLLQNKCHLNSLVAVQLVELVLFIASWIVFLIELKAIFNENRTPIQIRRLIAESSIFYSLVQVTLTLRIGMTCYMNVKQSRPIEECNREFALVLSSSADSVKRKNVAALADRIEREKAERRHRFYREYADQELARIITSLISAAAQSSSKQTLTSETGEVVTEGTRSWDETVPGSEADDIKFDKIIAQERQKII